MLLNFLLCFKNHWHSLNCISNANSAKAENEQRFYSEREKLVASLKTIVIFIKLFYLEAFKKLSSNTYQLLFSLHYLTELSTVWTKQALVVFKRPINSIKLDIEEPTVL